MQKSLFIKEEVRKIIKLPRKNGKTNMKFKIYNYNENSKRAVFDLFESKNKKGFDDFKLTIDELRLVLGMFTDNLFSVEELSEIIINPSVYFEQIFGEIEIILGELSILFVQEKTKDLMGLKMQNAVIDLNIAIADSVRELDVQKAINELQNIEV